MKYFLERKGKIVHWDGCRHFINRFTAIFLGRFADDDLAALQEGRKLEEKAMACSWCMNEVSDIPPLDKRTLKQVQKSLRAKEKKQTPPEKLRRGADWEAGNIQSANPWLAK